MSILSKREPTHTQTAKTQTHCRGPNTLNAHFGAGKLVGVHTSSKRSIGRSQVIGKLQSAGLWRIPVCTVDREVRLEEGMRMRYRCWNWCVR